MPIFKYVVRQRDGKTLKGVEEANSRNEIISRLKAKNFLIVAIDESHSDKGPINSNASQRAGTYVKKGHNKIMLLDLTFFARNLAITLSAGVSLLRSLEVISTQSDSLGLGRILQDVVKNVKQGYSLSESIAKYPKIFSSLWVGIVEVGEATGNLPFVLDKLAGYLERRLEF